jgi:phospholipase/carboxylesterase
MSTKAGSMVFTAVLAAGLGLANAATSADRTQQREAIPMAKQQSPSAQTGVLRARPHSGDTMDHGGRGVQALGLASGRDGLLYVPKRYDAAKPASLLVLLHGAGGQATHLVEPFVETAEARGYLILAPESRGRTWDVILGGYGPDVAFIDRALGHVFERYAVDPKRIAVGGFSDGASYALSLGISNGDLFTDILALSPGFMAPSRQSGKPRIFISHGVNDGVLPIDACSRRLAPKLKAAGYDFDYREFDGGHVVPPEMVTAAVARFLN